MIRFILLVNKQGQTRMARYYEKFTQDDRSKLEAEIIRRCMARNESQCSFIEYRSHKVVYRRYASLFFICGVDQSENELAVLELIHNYVELLDKYFESVCELDIMFNIERVNFIWDEVLLNGQVAETNKATILETMELVDATK